jgi:hypothetical protein
LVYFGGKKRCPSKNIIDHRCTVGVVYLTSCSNIFNIIIYKHIFSKLLSKCPSICPCIYVYPSVHLSTILKKGASFVSSHPAYNLIDLGRALDTTQYHIWSFTCTWCICSQGGAKKSNLWKHSEKTTNILIIFNNTHTSQALRHFLSGVERWHDRKRTAREAKPMPRWTSRSPRRGAISSLCSPWICKIVVIAGHHASLPKTKSGRTVH